MKYLLDTHAILWIVGDDEGLSEKVRKIYLKDVNDVYLSVASIWEIAIKISTKKLKIPEKLSKFVDKHVIGNNIQMLNVNAEHIYSLESLPFYHRDPFDRLLASQCLKEKMVLLSDDNIFDKYAIKRIW